MSSEVARGDLTVTHVRRSCREGTDCWSRPRQEGVGGGADDGRGHGGAGSE